MSVETLHTAASIRRPGNTFKAMLADTRDLLRGLNYATPEDKHAAELQIEAIDEVLTNGDRSA
jgi:hypothetical protein